MIRVKDITVQPTTWQGPAAKTRSADTQGDTFSEIFNTTQAQYAENSRPERIKKQHDESQKQLKSIEPERHSPADNHQDDQLQVEPKIQSPPRQEQDQSLPEQTESDSVQGSPAEPPVTDNNITPDAGNAGPIEVVSLNLVDPIAELKTQNLTNTPNNPPQQQAEPQQLIPAFPAKAQNTAAEPMSQSATKIPTPPAPAPGIQTISDNPTAPNPTMDTEAKSTDIFSENVPTKLPNDLIKNEPPDEEIVLINKTDHQKGSEATINTDTKVAEQKSSEQKSSEQKSSEQKSLEEKSSEQNVSFERNLRPSSPDDDENTQKSSTARFFTLLSQAKEGAVMETHVVAGDGSFREHHPGKSGRDETAGPKNTKAVAVGKSVVPNNPPTVLGLSRTEAARPTDMQENIERIVKAVRSAGNGSTTRIQLRLEPPELGFLRVEIKHSSTGLQLQFQATTAKAQQLLQQHVSELHAALDNHGLPARQINIQLRLDLRHESQGQPHSDSFGQHNPEQHAEEDSQHNQPRPKRYVVASGPQISELGPETSVYVNPNVTTATADIAWRKMEFPTMDLKI